MSPVGRELPVSVPLKHYRTHRSLRRPAPLPRLWRCRNPVDGAAPEPDLYQPSLTRNRDNPGCPAVPRVRRGRDLRDQISSPDPEALGVGMSCAPERTGRRRPRPSPLVSRAARRFYTSAPLQRLTPAAGCTDSGHAAMPGRANLILRPLIGPIAGPTSTRRL